MQRQLRYHFCSDTLCEPFTCPTVPRCFGDGVCELRLEDDCFNEGGFSGVGGSCEPDLCEESCTPLLVNNSDLDLAPGAKADVANSADAAPHSASSASGQFGANAGGSELIEGACCQSSRCFILPDSRSIRIRLVRTDGRSVATIANRVLEAGPHRIDWRPETRISNGNYFVVLESSGWKEVRSVVVAR